MRLDLVINIFVLNLKNKKKIFVDGDGNQYRPFISINDICKIYNILIKNNLLPSFICNLVYAYNHSKVFTNFSEYPFYIILSNSFWWGTESNA